MMNKPIEEIVEFLIEQKINELQLRNPVPVG